MSESTIEPRGFNAWLSSVYRLPERGICGGVIAGFSDHYGWNVRLARVAVIVATLFMLGTLALCAYGLLWYLLEPRRSADEAMSTEERKRYSRPWCRKSQKHTNDVSAAPSRPRSAAELRQSLARIDTRLRGLEACVTNRDFHLRREFQRLEADA